MVFAGGRPISSIVVFSKLIICLRYEERGYSDVLSISCQGCVYMLYFVKLYIHHPDCLIRYVSMIVIQRVFIQDLIKLAAHGLTSFQSIEGLSLTSLLFILISENCIVYV